MHHEEITGMEYWSVGFQKTITPSLHYSLLRVLAAALCLTGCMVGPDYQRPIVGVPAQFRAATTSEAESIADLKWFEVSKTSTSRI
jgi:hypothetical protein